MEKVFSKYKKAPQKEKNQLSFFIISAEMRRCHSSLPTINDTFVIPEVVFGWVTWVGEQLQMGGGFTSQPIQPRVVAEYEMKQ